MFTGFSVAALDFYDDLEMDNTRTFWEAHRGTYDSEIAAPMKALMAELADEFGHAKVFRPYRDVRFAKDKTPYKTAQGAFIAAGPSTGWYVQIGAPGVRVGAGFYEASTARLASIREAIVTNAMVPSWNAFSVRGSPTAGNWAATSSRRRRAGMTPIIHASGCCGTSR